MDSTTKWLIRGASVVVIAVGGTGIFTMINLLNKSQSGSSEILEMITNPGTATSKGNSCSPGFAYVGNGYCREVICENALARSNHPLLGGKKWRCKPWAADSFVLDVGTQMRIGNNQACPSGEPEIGWTSTCEAPYQEPPKSQRAQGRRR